MLVPVTVNLYESNSANRLSHGHAKSRSYHLVGEIHTRNCGTGSASPPRANQLEQADLGRAIRISLRRHEVPQHPPRRRPARPKRSAESFPLSHDSLDVDDLPADRVVHRMVEHLGFHLVLLDEQSEVVDRSQRCA